MVVRRHLLKKMVGQGLPGYVYTHTFDDQDRHDREDQWMKSGHFINFIATFPAGWSPRGFKTHRIHGIF